MFFLLGLLCLHRYTGANPIHEVAIKVAVNQNTSEPMISKELSKFMIKNDSQIRDYAYTTQEPHGPLSVGAIIGIVIGTMVGFCIFCCFCLFCLKGCLSD